jgi:hypothetical protein
MHPQPVANDYSQKVMSRYTDAYRLARAIVGVGTLVKVLGIVAAAIILLVGFEMVDGNFNATSRNGVLLTSLLVAGLAWLLFWVLGVLISAQGQILKANVDEAVNTSPFLGDNQRAQIMSLT